MQLKKLKQITFIYIITFLTGISLLGVYYFLQENEPKHNLNLYKTAVVKIDNKHIFNTYLAETPQKQQLGLMYQKNLPPNSAMLFTFANSTYQQFWMKNTLIPLDIIFINNNKIVDIEHNAKPCHKDPCSTYNSENPANQVLEINGGLSKKLNIDVGQEIIVNFDGIKN